MYRTAEYWIEAAHRPACDAHDIGGEDASQGRRVLMSTLGLAQLCWAREEEAVVGLLMLSLPRPACAQLRPSLSTVFAITGGSLRARPGEST